MCNSHKKEEVKYLRLHLDRRLTWHKRIFVKRKQLGITLTKMYWLLGCKSKLSTNNKLLLYKEILKPIWTYRIQLWGTASVSNMEFVNVSNMVIRRNLQIPTVKEEIQCYSFQSSAHPNVLIATLMELPDNRRL
jgi:hypothetical protein